MKFTYDPEVDALKISWGDYAAYADSDEVEEDVILDYDKEGRVIGIEILDAKERMELLTPDIERGGDTCSGVEGELLPAIGHPEVSQAA